MTVSRFLVNDLNGREAEVRYICDNSEKLPLERTFSGTTFQLLSATVGFFKKKLLRVYFKTLSLLFAARNYRAYSPFLSPSFKVEQPSLVSVIMQAEYNIVIGNITSGTVVIQR